MNEIKENEIFNFLSRKQIKYIMGSGKVISEVLEEVEAYAIQDCPLLFEGETGVGKKEIVTYLHSISLRRDKKLVTVDCGTIHENLIETELFGSKKGAYTDSKENRIGKIEIADGGTLFLDEINALSLAKQSKLLRVIEEKEITRVGDTEAIKVDVRILAAGNENFNNLVNNKYFRRDLYERFVDKIRIPTLRERQEDLDFFIDRFIKEKSNEIGKNGVIIDNEARDLLKNYKWGGNVRQLRNFIHKLITRVKYNENSKIYIISKILVMKCYLTEIQARADKTEIQFDEDEAFYDDYTWETAYNIARKNAVARALKKANGNVKKAIELLGISLRTYQEWKKK